MAENLQLVALDDDKIAQLRDRRLLTDLAAEVPSLLPIQSGERIAGPLTAQEALIFAEVEALRVYLEEWRRELLARSSDVMSQLLRDPKSTAQQARRYESSPIFNSTEEAEGYYRDVYRMSYLDSMLWMCVRERFGLWSSGKVFIRAGFLVVHTGPGYVLVAQEPIGA